MILSPPFSPAGQLLAFKDENNLPLAERQVVG